MLVACLLVARLLLGFQGLLGCSLLLLDLLGAWNWSLLGDLTVEHFTAAHKCSFAECCFAAGLIFAAANLYVAGCSFAAETSLLLALHLLLACCRRLIIQSVESSPPVCGLSADEVHRAAGPASVVRDLRVADLHSAADFC